MRCASKIARFLCAALCLVFFAHAALGQTRPDTEFADLQDRPISAIRFEGLKRVTEQTVRNNIRAAVGDPFDAQTIKDDVARLNRLGQFKYVDAAAELQPDGSVAIIYRFTEQALINEVQVVGNKLIPDQDLLAVVQLVPKGPRDDFLIQNAKRNLQALYRKRGHYLTTVDIDETELEKSGLLIFRITEGPRVKVRVIEFEGNQAFTDEQLYSQVKTRTAMFLFRKGELDEERLDDDVAALDRYYKDRGYLDVRVDRRIDLSPDSSEAKVTFLISEGRRYTLRYVRATTPDGKPLKVFAAEQIAAIMELKSGDVYSYDLLRKSTKAIQDAYGLMGYLATEETRRYYRLENWAVYVHTQVLRLPDSPQVDLLLEIDEGHRAGVGVVVINGNFLTQDRVIRREVRLHPGQTFDGTEIEKSQDRLLRTRLFNAARITVQREETAGQEEGAASRPEDAGGDEPLPSRDVLVEVKERNTGSFNFGAGLSSDLGVFGELSLTQNNFDVSDFPESLSELATGRAFRGAGQKFSAVLRPGTEIFQFATSLTEPHLLDSEYSFTIAGQFRDRIFDAYDEQRFGGSFRLGRNFGDVWSVGLQSRIEQIELNNIDPTAPTEVFLDAGPDVLTTLGINLTRTTIETLTRPGKGSRFELSFDRYGAFGGAFDFNAANAEYTVYFTVAEDFLGRISTVKLNSRVGYIFGGGRAPTYERYYMGGRSFRGFDFRTISPKGINAATGQPSNDPVGGTWLFFAGAQYEMPLLGDALTAVSFIDTGTVTDDPGFDQYRVSVGAGIRLYIPQFGDVPIAFDFGFPLLSQDRDQKQVFTFSAELPF